MESLEDLKREYTAVCAQLGDLLLQKENLANIEQALRNKISELRTKASQLQSAAAKGDSNEVAPSNDQKSDS